MLDLAHIVVKRVAVHHIPSRGLNKAVAIPSGGHSLVILPTAAKDMVVQRLTKVLGKNSNGIKVGVSDSTMTSCFQSAASMMSSTDSDFLKASSAMASALAKAQNNHQLAPCKLIILAGVVTALGLPFIAVIKAELQEALTEKSTPTSVTVNHLKDIFMTESHRLYKVGFFQCNVINPAVINNQYDPAQHSVYLFDHMMTGTETRSAAYYFYNDFLGCDIASSDKSLTRDFYEQTVEFFNKSIINPTLRIEMQEALRTELRSNKQTLSVDDFAKTHLDTTTASSYKKFMDKKGFPSHAITKNTEYVVGRLKKRQKVVFSSEVIITTPADKLDLIEILDNKDGTSTVKIKGIVQKSE